MGRKSKVQRLPPEVREFIEQLLREDRLTLDETLTAIRDRFPAQEVSRSGLYRYKAGFDELSARMREIDRAAEALIGGLGEGIGEKAGALLAHAVTTTVTHAALRAQESDDTAIDDIRKLAQAANHAANTRRLTFAERQAIEKAATERALREQREKLETLGKTGQIDPSVLAQVIKAAYDL